MRKRNIYIYAIVILNQFACSSPYLEISNRNSEFRGEQDAKIQIKEGLYEAIEKYVYTSKKVFREHAIPNYRYWVFQDGKMAMSYILLDKIRDTKELANEYKRNYRGKYYYTYPDSIYAVTFTNAEFQRSNTHYYFSVINDEKLQLHRRENLYKYSYPEREYYLQLIDSTFRVSSLNEVDEWSVEVVSDKKTWYSYFITNPLTYIGLLAMLSIIF